MGYNLFLEYGVELQIIGLGKSGVAAAKLASVLALDQNERLKPLEVWDWLPSFRFPKPIAFAFCILILVYS